MEQCPQCNTTVSVEVLGAYLKCETCGTRFPKARKKRERQASAAWSKHQDDGGELGIHPALARRYQRAPEEGVPGELTLDEVEPPPPSVQLSPSLVEETKKKDSEPGRREEAPTSVESKPGALRSESASGQAEYASEDSDVAPAGARPGLSTRPLRPSFEKPSTNRPNDTPLHRPATRAPRPKEPMPTLPGLEMLEQIGKGAMGRVFKARDQKTREIVAVKVLAAELAARQDFVARFEREAAALKRVDHPAVVAILDSGSHKEHHYLVMAYVEGVSLRRILDGGPLTPGRALDFARQITQGLGAAHAKSVIHRDLKPENILVERIEDDAGEETERLVLVDFGLAGIIDEQEDPHPNLTKSRMTMGTVNYMAPEQRTDAKRVDQRADLYAAGVILYELLTGDLPLGRFALPRERGLPLPESVDDCIHKALARNADERFRTAADLDAVLARIQSELSRAASMDTLVGRSLLDGSGEEPYDDDDSLELQMAGSMRSLVPRVPADELSTTSGKHEAWRTAPPWVRRPELLWGVLALALGAGAGLYLSNDGDVAEKGAQAPSLLIDDAAGIATVALAPRAHTRWSSVVDGWRAEGARVMFEGDALSPADPALLVSPEELSSHSVEVRVIVAVDSASPEGSAEPTSYGGVMLRTAGGTAVGVMRFTDGSCGVLELDDESARVSPFRCPSSTEPAEVLLRCSRPDGKCLVASGDGAEAEYPATLGEGSLSLAFACAGRRCSFENAPSEAAEGTRAPAKDAP